MLKGETHLANSRQNELTNFPGKMAGRGEAAEAGMVPPESIRERQQHKEV